MSSEAITRNDLTAILNEVLPNPADMTPQEVEDFVDGLNISGINAVDYVVEQGTDGTWTYRKWSSGIAECWTVFTYSSLAMTTAEGSGYYAPLKTESFPTDLFTATPAVEVGAELNGALGGFALSITSKTSLSGYFWATRSVTKTVYLHIHAIGRWK